MAHEKIKQKLTNFFFLQAIAITSKKEKPNVRRRVAKKDKITAVRQMSFFPQKKKQKR
jgi:hypothetical protein